MSHQVSLDFLHIRSQMLRNFEKRLSSVGMGTEPNPHHSSMIYVMITRLHTLLQWWQTTLEFNTWYIQQLKYTINILQFTKKEQCFVSCYLQYLMYCIWYNSCSSCWAAHVIPLSSLLVVRNKTIVIHHKCSIWIMKMRALYHIMKYIFTIRLIVVNFNCYSTYTATS